MKLRIARSFRTPILALLATALVWSCSDQPTDAEFPDLALTPTVSLQDLSVVMEVQERHTPELMRATNVIGTAVGLNAKGEPVVKVLARVERVGTLPKELEGFPVEVLVTGDFKALPVQDAQAAPDQPTPQAKPQCGKRGLPPCSPPLNARHPRPVPIGVSTGHPDITAGTLGVRVKSGNSVWALSNNHVYADENKADIGDALIQPGSFDGGSSPTDNIGTLADFEPIDFTSCAGGGANMIDAAIGATTTALVGNSTPLGVGYGTPRSMTILPAVNMKVKKVGRTTGFTTGTIQAVNATVNIGYDTGVACFVGQIVITPGSFSAGGDSGSLIVADGKGRNKADDRKPVGLLYAGSQTQTIANPIGPVLSRFGVTIDGN